MKKTTYYAGDYEEEVIPGQSVRKLHYIAGGDGLAAIFVKNGENDTMYYVHTDHLGSFDVITDQSGTVVQNYSFDVWGRRRNHTNWTYTSVPTAYLFSRGFTGHEHLDQFALINMNGRMYDPLLARFLAPDNYVQAPDFSQSFNRYSYCLNNPLIYIDPFGEKWWKTLLGTFLINLVGIPTYILTGGNFGFVGYYDDDKGKVEIWAGTLWDGGKAQVQLVFDDRKLSVYGSAVFDFDMNRNRRNSTLPPSSNNSGSTHIPEVRRNESNNYEKSIFSDNYGEDYLLASLYWGGSSGSDIWQNYVRISYDIDNMSTNTIHIFGAIRYSHINGNGYVDLNKIFSGYQYDPYLGYNSGRVLFTLNGMTIPTMLRFNLRMNPDRTYCTNVMFDGGFNVVRLLYWNGTMEEWEFWKNINYEFGTQRKHFKYLLNWLMNY